LQKLVNDRKHHHTNERGNESQHLLPAGGTISSSNFICVRFQIRNITDRSSSFASSMHPYSNTLCT